MALKVAVSPFYVKDAFYDEVSGITFEKSKTSAIYPYDVSNETKLDGIRKAVRLNVLLLLEGQLPEESPVRAEKVVAEEPRVEIPAQEEAPVEAPEAPEEPVVEAPKKSTKKTAK